MKKYNCEKHGKHIYWFTVIYPQYNDFRRKIKVCAICSDFEENKENPTVYPIKKLTLRNI